ncbi:uncharacterized protein LOC127749902 [Frankliniella occidentalis]|uniref:Uncharacterized protein LOC127749902 n=1 Tax=Frankliniella occidentalis TaxID=133901 RepID=A0A9C6WZF5_FRAOC|nr:uncharacterized protein LOC127749902 [Frankliniella occidentalis]
MGEASTSKVRYTSTQRGAKKAIYDGFMYVFHREKKDGAGWRCDLRGNCNGRITVLRDDTVLDQQPHTHEPDWGRCKAQETRAAFPDADVAGCLFHFGQAQWRQLQGAGLAVAYHLEANEEMRANFHTLIALAFVPVDDVEDAFDALSEASVLNLQPIFDHVEEN